MEFRIVAGRRGLAWFQDGMRMIDRNPRGLIAVSLGLGLLWQVPNLMLAVPVVSALLSMLFLLLLPALYAGLLHAIDEAHEGRPVSPAYLFEGLRRPGARAQLIVLGMVTVIAFMLAGLATQRILGPDATKVVVQIAFQQIKPDSAQAQAVAGPLLKAVGAAIAILFVLATTLFFAVPRVMFDGLRAPGAMAESLAACAGNVLSLAVFGLILGAAGIVILIGLGIAAAMLGLLGQVGVLLLDLLVLALLVLALLVVASAQYLAWREVFGHASGDGAATPRAGIVL